ncbi:DUF397 domain-containing protein [Yinghuangia sp. ASG 101]|uniref:DUF397 domain-containing protein n=1 Tax=Yinghuangia sp. ASG 101 TaxID=2896848 RepID=UPI001E3C1C7E|nr:DUF397 domain-containing protein [Yinghuangia sp. ASG 101]UGQ12798.1 DUF397 domain-containing protein [Yinghuangia sp. ASG 101]
MSVMEPVREVEGLAWTKSGYSGPEGGNCVEVAVTWTKSSYSASGGNCVEVATTWIKSSHSGSGGGDCVEVAATPPVLRVRDSKLPDLAILSFSAAHWSALTNSVRHTA